MLRKMMFILTALLIPVCAYTAEITVTDASITAGQTVTWTKNNTHILEGLVFVDSLATLIIEPGTVIKGMPGASENASALIVCRGGKIFAEGTKEEPIIFTALSDDLNDPNDLPLDAYGLWGGLIILGRATNNLLSGQGYIEGINPLEPRGWYGGTDDHDNSGVLRYVSIRHAGTEIGAGNEINGLTLGSVGDETVIEYIEVFCNYDDGVEFFGGTVNTKYIVVAFAGDDSFDYDLGYRGKNQFWFAIQGWHESHNRLAEMDGGESPKDAQPYSMPVIYNATFIGAGKTATFPESQGLKFRECAGGFYNNSIFTDSPGFGVDIESKITNDSNVMLQNGKLGLNNNIWWDFGVGSTMLAIANNKQYTADHLNAANNSIVNPLFGSISRDNNGGLDPRPSASGPAFGNLYALPTDTFFTPVNYKGAFGTQLWINGWTALSEYGFTPINPNDDIITEVAESSPSQFALVQNYPNPFNPSTTISFTIPTTGAVKLEVFDMIGQKVETLVNGNMNPGNYSVVWNASNRSSGVYFYRLSAGTTNVTKKMLFIK